MVLPGLSGGRAGHCRFFLFYANERIKDNFSGESRGFGFVEMPNKDEAGKAIPGLNGRDLKSRTLTVNEAHPRTDEPGTGGGKRF
jgi:RNA recognition motif-containing protein